MIIRARKILPITSPPIDNGAVVVMGRKIIDLGKEQAIIKKYPAEKVVDLGQRLVMPGLVNAHTHLELSNLQGMLGEKDDFFDWIIGLVELRKKIRDKGRSAAVLENLQGLLASGTTCIGDVSGTDKPLPEIIRSGIRAVFFLETIGPDEKQAERAFHELVRRLKRLKKLPERVLPGLSPHSPYSVSSRLFSNISEYTSSNKLSIAVHLSETKDETFYMSGKKSRMDAYMKHFGWDRFRKSYKGTSTRYLKEFGLLSRLLAVHAVHVDKNDIKMLKAAGASVAYCPRSNHLLGVGSAPVESFLESGINVGIGTDSLASNIDLDLWEEMRFAYLVNSIPASKIIEMGTIGGARALGLGSITGSLEPGKDADIIAIHTRASTKEDPYQALLLGTKKEDVSATIVQGKPLHSTDGYISYGI